MDSVMEVDVAFTGSSYCRGESHHQHLLIESYREEHLYAQPSNFEDILSQNKLKLACQNVLLGKQEIHQASREFGIEVIVLKRWVIVFFRYSNTY